MTAAANVGRTRGAGRRSRPQAVWVASLVAVAGMVAACAALGGTWKPATTAQLVAAGQVRLADLGTGGGVDGWTVSDEQGLVSCDKLSRAVLGADQDLDQFAVSQRFVRKEGTENPRTAISARSTAYVYTSAQAAQAAFDRIAVPTTIENCQSFGPEQGILIGAKVASTTPPFGDASTRLYLLAEEEGSDETDYRDYTFVRVDRTVLVLSFNPYGSALDLVGWEDAEDETVRNLVANVQAAGSVDPRDGQYATVPPPTSATPRTPPLPTPGTTTTDDPRGLAAAATLTRVDLATDANSTEWVETSPPPSRGCYYLTDTAPSLRKTLVAERHSNSWSNNAHDLGVFAWPIIEASTVAYVYPSAKKATKAAGDLDETTFVHCEAIGGDTGPADTAEVDLDVPLPTGATLQTYRSTQEPDGRGHFGVEDRSVLIVGKVVVILRFSLYGSDYTADQQSGLEAATIAKVAADIAAVP